MLSSKDAAVAPVDGNGVDGNEDIVDDVRVAELKPLIPPWVLTEEVPITEAVRHHVSLGRRQAQRILAMQDDRLLVVIGPCSIHDPKAAIEYAHKLKAAADELRDDLFVVMRVYFEKPRTTVGWKGLINDPDLDNSFSINKGLRTARTLLLDLNTLGLHAACELLDTISPQYIADLITWGAIGARTTESQVHRELASGVSCPVGFKNGTDGQIGIALDAIRAAAHPHHFLGVTKHGLCAIVATKGNSACHVILRGASHGPNYEASFVNDAAEQLKKKGLQPSVMVDCSHGNSQKNHNNQPVVARNVAEQVAAGSTAVHGLMIESNLVAGRQDVPPGGRDKLVYGQSITDACIDFDTSKEVLQVLAQAVRSRRALLQAR